MQDLARKAIDYALQNNWREAIKINKKILSLAPENVDALNRLSRAYFELGDIQSAIEWANKAISVDSLDPIAQRNLERYSLFSSSSPAEKIEKRISISTTFHKTFLEEPGKTKVINLLHVGDKRIICSMGCGEPVKILASEHRVSISSFDGKYIGRFPDDIARHVINLMNKGEKYKAYLKSWSEGEVKVIIRLESSGKFTAEH